MHKRQAPLVVSFYTMHTPYEQEVNDVLASLERWGPNMMCEGSRLVPTGKLTAT
jgi:hypothetical protein